MKSSIIIPTYGRNTATLLETLSSIISQGHDFEKYVEEIFVIDQNDIPLNLTSLPMEKIKLFQLHKEDPLPAPLESAKIPLYHYTHLRPSVTKAKNLACFKARAPLLIFFDDDVTLLPGCLKAHQSLHLENENIGIVGGYEKVDDPSKGRSRLKSSFVNFLEFFAQLTDRQKKKYQWDKHYIGRIHANSFFFCNYEVLVDHPILIDTVRGCNASLKRDIFLKVQGFNENFRGCALREESDFSLRIQKAGYTNIYSSNPKVIHRRGAGGCNNLSKNYWSFFSKLENELLFQQIHYPKANPFYFYLRTLPWAIDGIKTTWGTSLITHLQFCHNFGQIRKGKKTTQDFLPVF